MVYLRQCSEVAGWLFRWPLGVGWGLVGGWLAVGWWLVVGWLAVGLWLVVGWWMLHLRDRESL